MVRRKRKVSTKRRKAVRRRRRVRVRNVSTFKGVGRCVKMEKDANGRERVVAVRLFNSRTRRWYWEQVSCFAFMRRK